MVSSSSRQLKAYHIKKDSEVTLVTSATDSIASSFPVHAYIDNGRSEVKRDFAATLFFQNHYSSCSFSSITSWSPTYHANVYLPRSSEPRSFTSGNPVLCYLYTDKDSLYLRVAKIEHCSITYHMLDMENLGDFDQLTSENPLDEISCKAICSLEKGNVFVGMTPSISGVPCIDPVKEFSYFGSRNPVPLGNLTRDAIYKALTAKYNGLLKLARARKSDASLLERMIRTFQSTDCCYHLFARSCFQKAVHHESTHENIQWAQHVAGRGTSKVVLWKPSATAHEPLISNVGFVTGLIRANIHPRLIHIGTDNTTLNSGRLTRIGGVLNNSFLFQPLIGCDCSEPLHVDGLSLKPELRSLHPGGDFSDSASCDSSGNNLRDYTLVSGNAALTSYLSEGLPRNVRPRVVASGGAHFTYKFYRDEVETSAEDCRKILGEGFQIYDTFWNRSLRTCVTEWQSEKAASDISEAFRLFSVTHNEVVGIYKLSPTLVHLTYDCDADISGLIEAASKNKKDLIAFATNKSFDFFDQSLTTRILSAGVSVPRGAAPFTHWISGINEDWTRPQILAAFVSVGLPRPDASASQLPFYFSETAGFGLGVHVSKDAPSVGAHQVVLSFHPMNPLIRLGPIPSNATCIGHFQITPPSGQTPQFRSRERANQSLSAVDKEIVKRMEKVLNEKTGKAGKEAPIHPAPSRLSGATMDSAGTDPSCHPLASPLTGTIPPFTPTHEPDSKCAELGAGPPSGSTPSPSPSGTTESPPGTHLNSPTSLFQVFEPSRRAKRQRAVPASLQTQAYGPTRNGRKDPRRSRLGKKGTSPPLSQTAVSSDVRPPGRYEALNPETALVDDTLPDQITDGEVDHS